MKIRELRKHYQINSTSSPASPNHPSANSSLSLASHSPTKWPTKGAKTEAEVGKSEVDVSSSSNPQNEIKMTSSNPGNQDSKTTSETSKDVEGASDDGVEDAEPRKSKSRDLDLMPDIQTLEKRFRGDDSFCRDESNLIRMTSTVTTSYVRSNVVIVISCAKLFTILNSCVIDYNRFGSTHSNLCHYHRRHHQCCHHYHHRRRRCRSSTDTSPVDDGCLTPERSVQKNKRKCYKCRCKLDLAACELGRCKCGELLH